MQAPPGNTVGYVIQQWHPFSPKFIVANEHNEPVLKIHGPFCGWSCLPDVDFEVGLLKHREIREICENMTWLHSHPLDIIFLKEASSCSEARNVFPVTQAHGLDEATAQGMHLCGIV